MLDIPIISWVATAPDLNDRDEYTTLSRTLGPFSKMGSFLVEVMKLYNWRRVVIISSNYLQYKDATAAITGVFLDNNITIAYQWTYDGVPRNKVVGRMLKEAKAVGRSTFPCRVMVVVILAVVLAIVKAVILAVVLAVVLVVVLAVVLVVVLAVVLVCVIIYLILGWCCCWI